MSPTDARQEHEHKLLQIVQQDVGTKVSNVRLFESAEGSLAPLTLGDSKAEAQEIGRVVATSDETQTII